MRVNQLGITLLKNLTTRAATCAAGQSLSRAYGQPASRRLAGWLRKSNPQNCALQTALEQGVMRNRKKSWNHYQIFSRILCESGH